MADRPMRRRFYFESGLGTLTFLLMVVTFINQEWIEAVFRVDPDQGSGSAEWLVVVVLAVATVGLGVAARAEYRRPVTT